MNALPQDNDAPSGATAAIIVANFLGLLFGLVISLIFQVPWYYAIPLAIGLGILTASVIPIRFLWQTR